MKAWEVHDREMKQNPLKAQANELFRDFIYTIVIIILFYSVVTSSGKYSKLFEIFVYIVLKTLVKTYKALLDCYEFMALYFNALCLVSGTVFVALVFKKYI
jgi:uncharacterized membrane protein SirB2